MSKRAKASAPAGGEGGSSGAPVRGKPVPEGYERLAPQLAFYWEYHANPVNQVPTQTHTPRGGGGGGGPTPPPTPTPPPPPTPPHTHKRAG
jgi:hypothetical protein